MMAGPVASARLGGEQVSLPQRFISSPPPLATWARGATAFLEILGEAGRAVFAFLGSARGRLRVFRAGY